MGCTGGKPGPPQAAPPAEAPVPQRAMDMDASSGRGAEAETKVEQPEEEPKQVDAPTSFQVDLCRTAECQTIGAIVIFPDARCLLVKAVKKDGLIADWNARHAATPELQIKDGDVILGVNGTVGHARRMIQALKPMGPIVLTAAHKEHASVAASAHERAVHFSPKIHWSFASSSTHSGHNAKVDSLHRLPTFRSSQDAVAIHPEMAEVLQDTATVCGCF